MIQSLQDLVTQSVGQLVWRHGRVSMAIQSVRKFDKEDYTKWRASKQAHVAARKLDLIVVILILSST